MDRFLSLLLLAGMAWSSASAATQHSSLPSSVVPDGLGVNIHFTDPRPGEIEMLAAGGFHWVRMDLSWAGTEKVQGQHDFSAYDRLMSAVDGQKLRALFILDYGNPLYESGGEVRTETGRAAFARWSAAAAKHFAGRGILWEIWNEPNGGFWKPKANAEEYIALALATSKAIHKVAPKEAIIGPATSGVDFKFLEACFRAGLLQWWDAVSVHPYRQSGPETVEPDYARLRRLIAQYAPHGKTIPILSGEWGYSAAWNHFDPEEQGKMLPREWLINLANHIPLSIWYDWHDDGRDPKEPEHHFGTVTFEYHREESPVYSPKPAYLAAKTLVHALSGCEFRKRIALGNPEDYALLFSNGKALRLAVWTASMQPRVVTIPASPGQFEVLTHTGEVTHITAKDGGFHVSLTDAPQYVLVNQPNPLLRDAPEAHPLRARLAPVGDQLLAVQVDNLVDSPFTGTVRLIDIEGLTVKTAAQPITFASGETEKFVTFPIASISSREFASGLRIESQNAVVCELPARHFRLVPESVLTGCKAVPDGDAKVASQQSIDTAPPPAPLFGLKTQAWKLNYQCEAGWKFFRVVPKVETQREIPGQPRAFGCWIYGDAQHTSPRLRVVDASQQTWQPTGDEINWKGWRYVEMPLSPASAHWGGAKDGVIHFPLRWDSLLLLDNVRRRTNQGAIFFTTPVVIY